MKRTIVVLVVSLLYANVVFPQCPPGGKDKDGNVLTGEDAAFNKRKNKSARQPASEPEVLSIAALKSGRTKKDDRKTWYEGAYVEISDAYLIDYKEQGNESCNCHEAKGNKAKGDVHINIGNKRDLADGNNNYYVIVEITPSYKKLHPDYAAELKNLKGQKVIIRGYLFYDSEHERNSINYCTTCNEEGSGLWRKTCWEVHPVTSIALAE